MRKSIRAFTLVELLLVVGIIALGAVVAYITLPKVQSTARANAEATNINTLASGIKQLYAGVNNYNPSGGSALNNTVLINAKVMPDRMKNPDGSVRNMCGGFVITGATEMGNNSQYSSYYIRYEGVPQAECVKLATGVGNNFSQVSVMDTFVRLFPSTTAIDPSLVAVACQGGADSNNLVFYNQ